MGSTGTEVVYFLPSRVFFGKKQIYQGKEGEGPVSGKRKEPKPKGFGPDIFGWGGGIPCEWGGGQKVGYVPRSQGNQTFLVGYPGILLGYPGGGRKV